ncbi:type II secretion system F family protein [Microvirga sp. SRT01]|uniref:Type II secretion system F family protein n=2 Tax=Sphingomonas longa TaxID=2778730 RepID=A0ABS2DAU3_9SPHN|nr:type II secretion system F family protein [Microvirga sp. SRT01]MBM6577608.1 type II secretion system F family protein [Sphingomonas sp. BT552]MBR7710653.1 type II secretion system F family protein [Microvirga sp. SRT01]
MMPLIIVTVGGALILGMIALAFAGPSPQRAQARRIGALRERHGDSAVAVDAKLRRITNSRDTRMDVAVGRLLPNRAALAKRLAMTGKDWTVGNYGMATAGVTGVVALLLLLKGAPLLLALLLGLAMGAGIPHLVVGKVIKRRIAKFTSKFPDAIELLVRGLRSGLPISETMGVVGAEVDGPVGEEFRAIADKMKIGRTMDAAMQDTADRLGTPEFQFFVITIAIQRETGGNLAETLANLAEVLRKRSQMKLKIRAMSSESKASAYIIGSLPFVVFGLIWTINDTYMQNFFVDQRLIVAGLGGMIWMSIGAFIMAKMINFEI